MLSLDTTGRDSLFSYQPRPAVHTRPVRATPVVLCADAEMSDLRVRVAAERVVTAAGEFGDAQGAAAACTICRC